MRPPRKTSILVSLLLFGIIGFVVHETIGPNLCAHQGTVAIYSLAALVLLVVSLRFCKKDKSDGRSIRRVISYVLVIALSTGIWYEIWSLQACNETERSRIVHRTQ